MDLKTALAEARSTVQQAAKGWEPPARRPLSADPLLSASILRVGIRRGLPALASRAASTLVVFDPRRLWAELVRAAAEDIGPPNLNRLWEVMAISSDLRWRQRNGGEWHLASILIDRLAQTDKCRGTVDFARLAAQTKAQRANVSQGQMVALCQFLLLDSPADPRRYSVMDCLAEEGVPWLVIDTAMRAWNTSGSTAALAIPSLWNEQFEGVVFEDRGLAPRDAAIAALTHETPGGSKALSDFLESDEGLAELVRPESGSIFGTIEALGALVARRDFEAAVGGQWHIYRSIVDAQRRVPSIVDELIEDQRFVAKLPAIDDLRRVHLPPNLD